MDEGFSIELDRRGAVMILRLAGEVDMANVAEVEEQLLSVGNGGPLVVLDLHGLRYVDSAGIRMLFDTSERLGREGRRLALVVAADAPVRRVLAITKLDTLVDVHEDVAGAVAAAETPGT